MKCREFKKWVGDHVDGELADPLKGEFDAHMAECSSCRKSYEAIARAWHHLGEMPVIEPSPAFVSRFWTRVASQDARKENFVWGFKKMFVRQRLVPAALTLSAALIIGSMSVLKNYSSTIEVSLLGSSDAEFIENIELAEYLDIISDMDWLQDMEIIQNIDATQA